VKLLCWRLFSVGGLIFFLGACDELPDPPTIPSVGDAQSAPNETIMPPVKPSVSAPRPVKTCHPKPVEKPVEKPVTKPIEKPTTKPAATPVVSPPRKVSPVTVKPAERIPATVTPAAPPKPVAAIPERVPPAVKTVPQEMKPAAPVSESVDAESKHPPSAVVRPLPEPRHYAVKLSWGSLIYEAAYLSRVRNEDRAQVRFDVAIGQEGYDDISAVSNESYHYLLCAKADDGVLADFGSITIPRDYVVASGRRLTDTVVGVGRLFIHKGAELTSSGRRLSIEAQEIIVDDATISTFVTSEREGVAGARGFDGDIIEVRARKASGRLRIVARGQHGAHGRRGANGAEGGPGYRGDPGRSEAGRCVSPPTNGGPGKPGGNGETGQSGGRGGNSPLVFVKIVDAENLDLSVDVVPGEGGTGGGGGAGGLGGPGGPAGFLDDAAICPAAQSGPDGIAGSRGKTGEAGLPGSRSKVCALLGDRELYDCRDFPREAMTSQIGDVLSR
jgi:hypothetical protein